MTAVVEIPVTSQVVTAIRVADNDVVTVEARVDELAQLMIPRLAAQLLSDYSKQAPGYGYNDAADSMKLLLGEPARD